MCHEATLFHASVTIGDGCETLTKGRTSAECQGRTQQPSAPASMERSIQPSTLDAIRAALESAGVEFTNGDQPGVRLKARG